VGIFADSDATLFAQYGEPCTVTFPGGSDVAARCIVTPRERVEPSGQVGAVVAGFQVDLLVAEIADEPPEDTRIVTAMHTFRVREVERDGLKLVWECACDRA
jgi:hypothetical protein